MQIVKPLIQVFKAVREWIYSDFTFTTCVLDKESYKSRRTVAPATWYRITQRTILGYTYESREDITEEMQGA